MLVLVMLLAGCAGEKPTLGIELGKLRQCPSTPNCVNSQISDNEHFIEPIISHETILLTKKNIIRILGGMKNAQIKEVKSDYISVEFISSIFRFVDDVEFYFSVTNTKKVIVHVRSASRVGRSDFGVNRERIEKIRSQM